MKLHRFISSFNFDKKQFKILDKEIVNQMNKVLRLKRGDQVLLCDGNLNEALSTIVDIKKDFIEVKVEKISKNENESAGSITLYCSILKRENFELVVQKATEVGIKEIAPIITKRTVKLNLNQARLEKIIKEASEQSGRGIVPKLHKPVKFEEALEQATGKTNLFFDSRGDNHFYKALQKWLSEKSEVGIWIGPEGGWDEEELKLAKENKFQITNLGKLVLRAETAAIVASYIALTTNLQT